MLPTIIAGTVIFSLAILGLSLGVIFKKKTPLKSSCHATVDGGHEGACACGSKINSVELKKQDLIEGKFDLRVKTRGNFIKPD